MRMKWTMDNGNKYRGALSRIVHTIAQLWLFKIADHQQIDSIRHFVATLNPFIPIHVCIHDGIQSERMKENRRKQVLGCKVFHLQN